MLSWQSLRSVIKKSKANFIAFKQKKRASLYSTFFKCDDNHLLIWDCKTPKILLNFYIVKKSRTLTIEDKVTNFLLDFFSLKLKKRCRDSRDIVHLDKPKLTLLKIVLRKQLRLFFTSFVVVVFYWISHHKATNKINPFLCPCQEMTTWSFLKGLTINIPDRHYLHCTKKDARCRFYIHLWRVKLRCARNQIVITTLDLSCSRAPLMTNWHTTFNPLFKIMMHLVITLWLLSSDGASCSKLFKKNALRCQFHLLPHTAIISLKMTIRTDDYILELLIW